MKLKPAIETSRPDLLHDRLRYPIWLVAVLSIFLHSCATNPVPIEVDENYRFGLREGVECRAVAVSPNGLQLAAVCGTPDPWFIRRDKHEEVYLEEQVEVIETETGKLLGIVKVNAPPIDAFAHSAVRLASVAYSPDGHIIAATTLGGQIQLLDARTIISIPFPHDQDGSMQATTLAFSASGGHLAIGYNRRESDNEGLIGIFNIADPTDVSYLPVNTDYSITSIAFSPDGSVLAAALHQRPFGIVRLWNWRTGAELQALKHDQPVGSIIFTPDNRQLLTLSEDLKVWRLVADDFFKGQSSLAEVLSNARPSRVSKTAMVSPELWLLGPIESEQNLCCRKRVPPKMVLSPDGLTLAIAELMGINFVDIETLNTMCSSDLGLGPWGYKKGSYYDSIKKMHSYPHGIAWSPRGDKVAVAFNGLGIVQMPYKVAGGKQFTARLEALEPAIDVPQEVRKSVYSEMQMALLGNGLFTQGDELVIQYRIMGHQQGNRFQRLMAAKTKWDESISLEVQFLAKDGSQLVQTTAYGSTSIFWPGPHTMTNLKSPAKLAWQRAAANIAKQAAQFFGEGCAVVAD